MSFKRRESATKTNASLLRGVRPSATDGLPVTSSGCPSFDAVLAGHGGIPLGSGLLVEENGTTDYSSVLLRYFAAEGILQGQTLWVGGGNGSQWLQGLPLAVEPKQSDNTSAKKLEERMKIAWRYGGLGEFSSIGRSKVMPNDASSGNPDSTQNLFCHSYDLTKRMIIADKTLIVSSPSCNSAGDPFLPVLSSLVKTIQQTTGVIRCVLPNLLSPLLYPHGASQSKYIVKFVNNLRAILRAYPSRLLLMVSISLDLYPKTSQTSAWLEILLDGVIEMTPLPPALRERDGPQGLLKFLKIPRLDRHFLEIDLSFKVSRRHFTIEAWSLPALGEEQPREGGGALKDVKSSKVDISF